MNAPTEYAGATVPLDVRKVWRTWAGVEWRIDQHAARGNVYPPDQRFGADLPDGMCSVHRRHWYSWRNKHFRGRVWPGYYAGGFRDGRHSLETEWEQHRRWWDEKTIEQMQAVESVCLSGRSRQCAGARRLAVAA